MSDKEQEEDLDRLLEVLQAVRDAELERLRNAVLLRDLAREIVEMRQTRRRVTEERRVLMDE